MTLSDSYSLMIGRRPPQHHERADARPGLATLWAIIVSATLPWGWPGFVAAVLIAPFWVRLARQYWGIRTLLISLLASGAFGFLLTWANPAGGSYSPVIAGEVYQLLFFAIVTIGSLLWSRSKIGAASTAVVYALSTLTKALVMYWPAMDANTWKYNYSWPVVILVLAIASWSSSRVVQSLGVAVAVAVSFTAEYRSLAAIVIVALLLFLLRPLFRRLMAAENARRPAVRVSLSIAAIVALVAGLYQVLESALLDGVFGAALQVKTQEQILYYGSLLGGGRVEAPITMNLMAVSPFGFGPGYVPTSREYTEGAYAQIIYAGQEPYLQQYTFFERIKLHSFWGDFWVNFGPVGLVTVGVMIVIVAVSLFAAVTSVRTSIVVVALAVWTFWDVLYSPIYSNLLYACLAIAVIVPLRSTDARLRLDRNRTETSELLR